MGYTYLRARYYDPATGRFLSKDPFPGVLTNPASFSYYVYAQGSPTNLVDPSGQIEEDPEMACGERLFNDCLGGVGGGGGSGPGGDIPGADITWDFGFGGASSDVPPAAAEASVSGAGAAGTEAAAETCPEATAGEAGGALAPTYSLGYHARVERMEPRGITEDMIKLALQKGDPYWDPEHGTIDYIIKGGFASGKDLLVGQNPWSGRITTVIRGNDLVSKRMVLIK